MDVLIQCSECLEKLHAIGVVHRDVKPENFLLSKNAHDGSVRVVISDFGLSTIIKKQTGNTNCGTTSYKAPEIVKNWSLKCTDRMVSYAGFVRTL
jgi:serine/threonine protein kinase